MFRVRPADKEDRAKVFEALRQTQEALDQIKSTFDAPEFPDEALIRCCSQQIGYQLSEFYTSLTHAHRILTEVTLGYTPEDWTDVENEYPF